MKQYLPLILSPLILRYAWKLVKYAWPFIKVGCGLIYFYYSNRDKAKQFAFINPRKGVTPMAEQFGIKETKEVIALVLDIALAFVAAKTDDGVINTADLPKFLAPVMEIPQAVEGITQIPAELKDFHESEMAEIKDYVIQKAAAIPGIETKWLKVASGCLTIARGGIEIWDAFK